MYKQIFMDFKGGERDPGHSVGYRQYEYISVSTASHSSTTDIIVSNVTDSGVYSKPTYTSGLVVWLFNIR